MSFTKDTVHWKQQRQNLSTNDAHEEYPVGHIFPPEARETRGKDREMRRWGGTVNNMPQYENGKIMLTGGDMEVHDWIKFIRCHMENVSCDVKVTKGETSEEDGENGRECQKLAYAPLVRFAWNLRVVDRNNKRSSIVLESYL